MQLQLHSYRFRKDFLPKGDNEPSFYNITFKLVIFVSIITFRTGGKTFLLSLFMICLIMVLIHWMDNENLITYTICRITSVYWRQTRKSMILSFLFCHFCESLIFVSECFKLLVWLKLAFKESGFFFAGLMKKHSPLMKWE